MEIKEGVKICQELVNRMVLVCVCVCVCVCCPFSKIKNEKGFTLISAIMYLLVATIVISLIVAISAGVIKSFRVANDDTAKITEINKINMYMLEEMNNPENKIDVISADGTYISFTQGGKYTFKGNILYKDTYKIAEGIETVEGTKFFSVDQQNGKTVLTVNLKINGKDEQNSYVSRGLATTDNLLVADGSWNGTVNTPKLATGMKAVYWAKDSSGDIDTVTPSNNTYEINQDDPNFKVQNWYDYVAQTGTTDGKTSRWANAKTADGSYWVWVPRYEYKIDYTGVEQGINTDETKAGKIYVRFIPTSTKSGSSGYTTATSKGQTVNGVVVDTGITVSSDGYIIHPAFTDGTSDGFANGEWDSELAGFWVAKFDMSMQNGSGANVNTSSATIGNVALSSTVKAVSKPGVSIWRYINIANCYTNSYDYDRTKESHLIKNSEWGAVAYLTHSKYGRNGTKVTINSNSSYITGGGTGTAYLTSNVVQSSTGNSTGVYDVSGCAGESTASFNKAYSGTYFTGTSYLSAGKTHFASTGGNSTKYATAYNNTSTWQTPASLSDFANGSHVGEAIQEVWIKGASSWFSNYLDYINITYPFYYRSRCFK